MNQILQSLMHLLVLPMAALGAFYIGYRGLAEPDKTLTARFEVAQTALIIVYFVFSIAPLGCVNGILRLQKLDAKTSGFNGDSARSPPHETRSKHIIDLECVEFGYCVQIDQGVK
eukprot:TRINITY_DN16806_c0_g1_i2.p1 TRINITY_DN16806_c0_g1~~TRINITY_DN16806_c0_g1_i2.p1  ORF type:complete len:115 (+),score=3.87 TRINITY_DN16806_c0_g1_i2:318-662(+)